MTEVVEPGGGKRVWRELRSNPDYVADWRAHAGEPAPLEPAPFPLRAQTVADLAAARWGLLAWEDPGVGSRASPFWADVPMVEAVVAKPEGSGGEALSDVVRKSDATAQRPTVSCGTERPHLPPLGPAGVTKSSPGMADCHETPFPAVRFDSKIALLQ